MLAFYLLLVGLAGTFASPVLLDEQPIDSPVLLDEQPIDSPVLLDEQPIDSPFLLDEQSASIDERIVGGRSGSIQEVPYLVSVRLDGGHICGGTIISQDWIVSAAHCFERSASRYSIRAGSTTRIAGGSTYRVSRLVKHPSYGRPRSLSNDIAVLRLSSSLRWSNRIRAATLPTQNQAVTAGTTSRISGWGATSDGSGIFLPNTVRIADVPIVSQSACRSAYGTNAITNDMLCAGFTRGGIDACQGDSGGPLVISGRLFGAVSWGRGCARPGFPGVYASVPYFRNWIRQTTGV